MPKKTRSRAARYSELSRGKRKPQEKDYSHLKTAPSDFAPAASAAPAVSEKKTVAPAGKAQGELVIPGFSVAQVRTDLKKIGVISGGIIVVLIILSFVIS